MKWVEGTRLVAARAAACVLWFWFVLPTPPVLGAQYAWPLKKYAGCTSMFGDHRPARYHAGIDLRTGGQEGWKVVAVADGYVMRASTSYYGYGRALYLKLDDGHIAVYGHLQSFGPQVTRRVREVQRQSGRYRTNIYFDKDAVRVRKGMTIARAGQTGAGAPHLHFELRTADNRPLNPLTHGFPLRDHLDPVIRRLWLIPGYENGTVGQGPAGPDPQHIRVRGKSNTPLRVVGDTVYASGPVGFAVEAYDRKPGGGQRHNITGMTLWVGADTVFASNYDTLVFESMAYIELERALSLNGSGDVYNFFRRPGNALPHSHANPSYPGGMINVESDDPPHPFRLIVTDERGNRRTILGVIAWSPPSAEWVDTPARGIRVHSHYLDVCRSAEFADDVHTTMVVKGLSGHRHPWRHDATRGDRFYAADVDDTLMQQIAMDTTSRVADRGRFVMSVLPGWSTQYVLPDSSLLVAVPADATYENTLLEVAQHTEAGRPAWSVGSDDLIQRTPIELSFAAPADARMSLWTLNADGEISGFVDNRRGADGRIACTHRGSATYTFGMDTTAPVIARVRPANQSTVRPDAVIRARLEDDLSGVGNDSMIVVRLDGTWIPPEYDPETRQLIARPWGRLAPGTHRLELEVRDWAGNVARREQTFVVRSR